jgi:hypothetical protein
MCALENCQWWEEPCFELAAISTDGLLPQIPSRDRQCYKINVKVILWPTVIRSVRFGVSHPSGTPQLIFPLLSLIIFRQLQFCWCGAPSLMRRRVCSFHFLPGIASAAFLRSESHWTHEHILLCLFLRLPQPLRPGSCICFPQEQGSPVILLGNLVCLINLHIVTWYICSSCMYNPYITPLGNALSSSYFATDGLCVGPPSGTHFQNFITVILLQSSCCGAPSLTRGRVCILLMQFAATLLSKVPRNSWPRLTVSLETTGFPFCRSYDSQPVSTRGRQSRVFFFVIPFYLQSILVHSANCV